MSFLLPKKEKEKQMDYYLCKKIILKNLSKYNKSKEELSYNLIQQLIFHKKSHFTSIFIEYLIWDDYQEFLMKFFDKKILSRIRPNPRYTKKYFFPTLLDPKGRLIILQNLKKKKILSLNLLEKIQPKINNLIKPPKNLKKDKFNLNILPPDISGEKKLFENKEISKASELKSQKSESETIDNINANNDISISLDLKINKNYDKNIIYKNSAFVDNKNGEIDTEIMKVINFLNYNKSEKIKKKNIINKNRVFCFEDLNDIINSNKNKIKIGNNNHNFIFYSNNNSPYKNHKRENLLINKTGKYYNLFENVNKIKSNSLNNKIKHKDIINNSNNNKNIIKINIKKNNPKLEINSTNKKNKSKKSSKNKINRNIILTSKLNNISSSTKTNTNTNNKIAKQNENKLTNFITPSKERKTSTSPKTSKKENTNSKLNSNNKIKKIILDNKIISPNYIKREKYIEKKIKYISPDNNKKYFINSKIKGDNNLLIEKILNTKKEKSFDNKSSTRNSIKSKNSANKLTSTNSKKIL